MSSDFLRKQNLPVHALHGLVCVKWKSAFKHHRTYLYNSDPLKPHFYIVKLGLTEVYIIFIISAQNIDCGYLLELPRRGGSKEYPQSIFLSW